MDILDFNISENPEATNRDGVRGVEVERRILDWDWDLHKMEAESTERERLGGSEADLVVVSDCTYNVDSLPALVRTIGALLKHKRYRSVGHRGDPLVIVSLKRRHASESVFFELMREAGFSVAGKEEMVLPDSARRSRGEKAEMVEIWGFRFSGE